MGVSKSLSNYLIAFGGREMVRGSILGETFNVGFQAFYVNQDATIISLQDKDGVEVMNSFGLMPPKNIMYQGGYLAADETNYFSSITLTDGNIVIITTGSYSNPPNQDNNNEEGD
jgi:hypothetical protein